jgi:hypothetical protein
VSAVIDSSAIHAIFAVPQTDGAYEGATLSYLRKVGALRPVLLLAFAPKAAGTFFREAAIRAVGGQLVRFVHAQGGRDGVPYLPFLLSCYLDRDAPAAVGHVHMQALTANRHFMAALGLKPVIMLRDLADMLASFLDMLEQDPAARAEGLNCQVPADFPALPRAERCDFMIEIIAPWYASYFATWKDFADQEPDTVCVLSYRDFCADPVEALWTALSHADFVIGHEECEAALQSVWGERGQFRFNRGVAGRGRSYFSPGHFARLRKLLSFYPQLESWMPQLLGEADADIA